MKGKQAAQSAQRRLAESQARIAELQSARDADASEARQREHELQTELDRLRGALSTGIKDAAAHRVQEVIDKASTDLVGARLDYEARLRRACHYINKDCELRMPARGVVELAKILGIQPSDLFEWSGVKRYNKRATRQRVNLVNDIYNAKGIDSAAADGLAKVWREHA